MKISPQGTAFIAAHEGFVSRAYRCPAGVVTIGFGFTMGSRIFTEFWRGRHGRGLQMGDTITRADADTVLAALLNDEYGKAVTTRIGTRKQHEWDGATSVAYNCGTGALAWRWAVALAGGAVAEAGKLLRSTAVTANGRRLAGLVRRREEEATLIETGRYAGGTQASVSTGAEAVRAYQMQLATLGYDVGPADGVAGPRTESVVRRFQADHNLKVDGIVGPATRAALIRALDARSGNRATGMAGAGTGIAGSGTDSIAAPDSSIADALLAAVMWGVGAAIVVGIAFLAWRYRGIVTGRRVPT